METLDQKNSIFGKLECCDVELETPLVAIQPTFQFQEHLYMPCLPCQLSSDVITKPFAASPLTDSHASFTFKHQKSIKIGIAMDH